MAKPGEIREERKVWIGIENCPRTSVRDLCRQERISLSPRSGGACPDSQSGTSGWNYDPSHFVRQQIPISSRFWSSRIVWFMSAKDVRGIVERLDDVGTWRHRSNTTTAQTARTRRNRSAASSRFFGMSAMGHLHRAEDRQAKSLLRRVSGASKRPLSQEFYPMTLISHFLSGRHSGGSRTSRHIAVGRRLTIGDVTPPIPPSRTLLTRSPGARSTRSPVSWKNAAALSLQATSRKSI